MPDQTPPDSAGAVAPPRPGTNPVIEQAKGILMARHGCTPDQAFELLRRASQRANIKLSALAAALAEQAASATRPDTSPSPVPAPLRPRRAALARGRTGGVAGTVAPTATDELSTSDRRPSPGAPDERSPVDRQFPPALPAGTVVVTMPGGLDHGNAAQVTQRLATAFAPGVDTVIADFTPAAFRGSSGATSPVTAPNAFQVVIPRRHLGDFLTPARPTIHWSLHPSSAQVPDTDPKHPNRTNEMQAG